MRHRAPEIVSIDAGLMKRWRCIIYAAIGQDHLAIAIVRFLNTYWIAAVGLCWLIIQGATAIMKSARPNQASQASSRAAPSEAPEG